MDKVWLWVGCALFVGLTIGLVLGGWALEQDLNACSNALSTCRGLVVNYTRTCKYSLIVDGLGANVSVGS